MPTHVDSTRLEQRIVEAVACLPPGTAATGWAGLAWLHARWFNGFGPDGKPLPVPVALNDRRTARPRSGVIFTEDWLFADDVITIDGLPITIPERAVTHAARVAPTLTAALQVIDMAAYDDLIDLASLSSYAERLTGRPGSVQLRTALARANENAWSPQEVLMRTLWEDAIPGVRLLCNTPVFDLNGRHLLTPDLIDLDAGLFGEYDGPQHLEDHQRSRDLTREDLTHRLQVEVVTMMAGARERSLFLDRLHGARARAAGMPGPRRWTIEQPDSWVDTSTVARRRALTAYERAMWLGWRRPEPSRT